MITRSKSDALYEEAKQYLPGGVNSPVRAFRSVNGSPIYFEKGKGSHTWDADGNEYLDFCCSWGPLILGHADEGVLSKVEYLENIAPQHMYLFKVEKSQLRLIGLKIKADNIDLTTKEGFSWLRENLMSDEVELFNADKSIEADKNIKLFELIKQGSSITKGALFKYLEDLIG